MKLSKALLEYYGVDPARVPDFVEFWALYATSFYEKLFGTIDDPKRLENMYNYILEHKKLTKRDKEALAFFYNLRRDELEDPDFWKKTGMAQTVKENKNINMKAKLVRESLNEYYDSEPDELSIAKQEAREISREEGVAQHVNEIRPGVYRVEDWFDADTTVASYENGRSLDESLNENYSIDEDSLSQMIMDIGGSDVLKSGVDQMRNPAIFSAEIDAYGNEYDM